MNESFFRAPGVAQIHSKGHLDATRVLALVAVLFLFFSIGCSSRNSVKQLDERSAGNLIKDRLSKERYQIRADHINKFLIRSLVDYKAANPETAEEATIKTLLDKGFVSQTVETLSYPQISGTFVSQGQYGGVWTVYDLEMRPNSNIFTGDSYRANSHDSPTKPADTWWVQGSVEPNGSIKLNTSGTLENAGYVEEGGDGYIDFKGSSSWGRYKGPATRKKININSYTYAWSPDFLQKLTSREGNILYVNGGTFEVGEVSELRLLTETVATAKFAWKASLNDTGRIFSPKEIPGGTGEVSFGKKPDGTWFVDQISIE
jgi:hypothetical protein